MSEPKTAIQQAAAELRGVACETFATHTIDGVWPHGEDQAKANHDHLLFLADIIEKEEQSRGQTCAWRQDAAWDHSDTWNTDCGEAFVFIDGTPADNNANYCCYCGRKIEQVPAG